MDCGYSLVVSGQEMTLCEGCGRGLVDARASLCRPCYLRAGRERQDYVETVYRRSVREGKPMPTREEMADALGVTRQRISQIIGRLGIVVPPTWHREPALCATCGRGLVDARVSHCRPCYLRRRQDQGSQRTGRDR